MSPSCPTTEAGGSRRCQRQRSLKPASVPSTDCGFGTPTAVPRASRRCCSRVRGRRACTRSRGCGTRSHEHAGLFAIDLPGFGASESRDDLMSPRAMGGFLAEVIVEADLGRPHIVAPDVGTSAALFAASAHPERIATVIVGTGGAAVPIQLGEPLKSWVLDPDLDKYRRMDPHAIVNVAADTIAGGIPDDVRADYLTCYEGDRFVESMRYVRRYPRGAARARRVAPGDRHAGHDHQRPPRPRRSGRQRRIPGRAAAQQPRRADRRRSLRLGGGAERSTPRSSSTRSRAPAHEAAIRQPDHHAQHC